MTVKATHAYTAGGTNDPSKEVSKDRWNADHPITQTAAGLIGATAAGTSDVLTQRDALGLLGGGFMTLVASDIRTAAGTTLTLSGLDLAADSVYMLEYSLKDASGAANNVSMTYNGDTTAANYYVQYGYTASATTQSAARVNTAVVDQLFANAAHVGEIKIRQDVNGNPRAIFHFARDVVTTLQVMGGAHVRNNTANVTSITFTGVGNFAIGSYVKVYKLNASVGTPGGLPMRRLAAKTADTTRVSTTTLADDPHLSLALEAGKRYRVHLTLDFTAANSTMGIKYALGYSGTMGNVRSILRYFAPGTSGGTGAEWQERAAALPNAGVGLSNSGTGSFDIELIVETTTAGTLALQWAQNTSNASNLTVLAGSMLEVEDISTPSTSIIPGSEIYDSRNEWLFGA